MTPNIPKPTMPQQAATAELPPFTLAAPATLNFWWTVRVPYPVNDGYAYTGLKCLFLHLPQDELDKMKGQGLAEGELPPTDADIARRVWLGWEGVSDEAKAPLPFSLEARDKLLAVPMLQSALVATYMAVMAGMGARKN